MSKNDFPYKIGDAFMDTQGHSKGKIFEIVDITDEFVYYIVEGKNNVIDRTFDIWNLWVDSGELIPATELIKALR